MSGLDADGFPPAETLWGRRDMIVLIIVPTGPEECRLEYRTEHPMEDWEIVRDLRTAAEIIETGGAEGVTSTGMIVTSRRSNG